jgi:plasmid stability protein
MGYLRPMPTIQVRGVPDDVHRHLKSQAALAGQSLNEFLLARLSDIARVPTVPDLADRIGEGAPYTGPSSAGVIREERERR